MQLSLIGLSHHTAPVEVRERLHFPEKDTPPALHALRERPGVGEALIFSTCNRVEVLARLEDGLEALPLLADFLATTRRVAPESFQSYLYPHSPREAVRPGLPDALPPPPPPPRRRGAGPPLLPRAREPRLHDPGRAAGAGPGEGRLR